MNEPPNNYLELMKKCLTNWIYFDHENIPISPIVFWKKWITDFFKAFGLLITSPAKTNRSNRKSGIDWPAYAHTMIGLNRLDNIQFCIEDILEKNIPGDVMEAGIWRGGGAIFMRAVLKTHNIKNRVVWAADSFKGLPRPDVKKYPQDKNSDFHTHKILSVPLSEVKKNFDTYGLLDSQVRFLEGWFKDTLPGAPIKKLAIIRLDADMYESTMDALTHLYPKLSPGGYIIIDDYNHIKPCRQAVDDYRKSNNIDEKIIPIDWSGIYWKHR